MPDDIFGYSGGGSNSWIGREEPSSPMAASCSEPVRAGAGVAHEGSRGGPLAGPDVGASPAWDGPGCALPKDTRGVTFQLFGGRTKWET